MFGWLIGWLVKVVIVFFVKNGQKVSEEIKFKDKRRKYQVEREKEEEEEKKSKLD